MKNRYFTLVELLTVIGIVAILASLLLTAVSKSRAKAIRVECINNNRQLNVAMAVYATDSGGYFPPYYPNWFGGKYYWTKNFIYNGYVTNAKLLVCTEVALQPYGEAGMDHRSVMELYIQRIRDEGRGLGYDSFIAGRISYGYNWAAFGRNKTPAKNNQVRKPSQTIQFAENKRHDPAVQGKGETSSFVVARKGEKEPPDGTITGYIWPRHEMKLAVGWADGHATLEKVTTLDREEIYRIAPFDHGDATTPEKPGYSENYWDLD